MNRLKTFFKYFIIFILVFFIIDISIFCIIELPKEKQNDNMYKTIQSQENTFQKTFEEIRFVFLKYISNF